MTYEQRHNASVDLSITFLKSYYPSWRLTKVLGIQKTLETRYDFYKEIAVKTANGDDTTGEATIAQEIKNGLYFDAISECVQCIEDLFALIKAAENPDYFVRGIITYKAHKINDYIKRFEVSEETIAKAFHFPIKMPFLSDDDRKVFNDAVSTLCDLVKDCIKFNSEYRFLYNQYKHGLTVGMRTFGNQFTHEQIAEDKDGKFPPSLWVYDNVNPSDAMKWGRLDTNAGIFLPGFTANVQSVLHELSLEDNFLRLIPAHNTEIDIGRFVDMAYKIRACMNTFIYNYEWKLLPEKNKIKFQLPDNYRDNIYLIAVYNLADNS